MGEKKSRIEIGPVNWVCFLVCLLNISISPLSWYWLGWIAHSTHMVIHLTALPCRNTLIHWWGGAVDRWHHYTYCLCQHRGGFSTNCSPDGCTPGAPVLPPFVNFSSIHQMARQMHIKEGVWAWRRVPLIHTSVVDWNAPQGLTV